MRNSSKLSQRRHWELPSKVHSQCTKLQISSHPSPSPSFPGEQLFHGRGVSVPPFAPSSCLFQHAPGLYSETVSCLVIPAKLPSKLGLMRSFGEGDIHIKKWGL